MVRVHIPSIADLKTAIRIYYTKIELDCADIHELFPSASKSTVTKLKNKARELMTEKGVLTYGTYSVNTKTAFKAWGLDISDIEKRYEKLKKLDMAV